MNQIYSKPRYLFLLLGFFVCSAGMAQSSLQKNKPGNVQMTIQSPAAIQKKAQLSKKTADPSVGAINESDAQFLPKEEKRKGKELSKQESDAVKKRVEESKKFLGQKTNSSTAKSMPKDTITKVKSFAKSANLTVRNVFEVKKGEFELSGSDKMQLKSVSDKHGRTLATYQQFHNAIPVEGAIYKVRENKTKIDAFGQTSKKLPTRSKYKVNSAQGLDNAMKHVNAKQYVWQSKKMSALVNQKISKKPEGELVYVGPNYSSKLKEYHLAWKYDVFATNPQSSQTVYVDADSGEVILKVDLSRDVQVSGQNHSAAADNNIGKGKSRYSGEVTFNTKLYPEGYKLEGLQGKYKVPMTTLNMNHYDHPTDEILTEYIDEDNNWNDLYDKDGNEAAIDIHYGIQKTIDYYEEKFDRNSVDDKGMNIIGLAHLGTNVENASWTGAWAQFGDGYSTPYVSLAITGHELTHAVTQFSADLIYEGESGAMNESFSDIFGVSIEFYSGKDTEKDIWMLGDELYSHGSLRSMADPKAQGQPDTYGGENWADPADTSYDNGGVHVNSGITNYWYYLLVKGGDGVNDLNENYSVKGLGLAKAEKIAYITLTEYLAPSANFSDMRQASLLAAEDLYGIGSQEYIQVTNAWHAIGVGPAFSDKQFAISSIENPTVSCGSLKGDEPFYIKIKNTGAVVMKAKDSINYKWRLMTAGYGGSFYDLYENAGAVTLDKDLGVGEEATIKIQDSIPYQISATDLNYVEFKLDLKPVEEFGSQDGVSVISSFLVTPSQQDYDVKVLGLNLPAYTGGALPANHALSLKLYNLGCQDIVAGTKFKVGYLNTAQTDTIWKEVTLTADFAKKSEITIPFDTTIDLSKAGLHTYQSFLEFDKDPVVDNNNATDAVYNGIVAQLPYDMAFEKTPGGWYTKSLNAVDQKFIWQPAPVSFRNTNSKYAWACIQFGDEASRVAINADFTLESPIFDFTNAASPYVEFDLYYLLHKGYDGLIVEYSEDKGQSWKKVADANYPTDLHYNELVEGDWFTGINTIRSKAPYQMRLDELAGKKAAIRFRVLTDDYNDGFIGALVDNIHVSDAPYDLEVVSSKLNAGTCTVDNTNVTVNTAIMNNFAKSSQPVVITTKILDADQNEVFAKTEKTTLVFTKFRDTLMYSVPNISLKNVGEHTISVSVFPEDMAKDLKPANNSVTFYYDNWKNDDQKIAVLPYKMDFEQDSKYNGWRTFENKNADGWKHGLRDDLGSPGWYIDDHTHFMASNDDKCNCDSSNDMLVSPVFDLTNYKEAYLSFDGFADYLELSDGYVKVSTDGGKTWAEAYHLPYYGAWAPYHVDLSAYAGKSCVQVAFVHNDNGLFASGFAVDNIELKATKESVGLSHLSIAEKVYEDASSHEFFVSAMNLDYKTIDKVKIEYQISKGGTAVGAPVVLERTDPILESQTIVYKIDGLPKLDAGNYEINVKVIAEGTPNDKAQSIKGTFQVVDKAPELALEIFSTVDNGPLFGTNGYVSNQSDENYPFRNVTTPDNEYLSLPMADHTGDIATKMLYSQLEGYSYESELISPVYKVSDKATALEFYYAMESNYNNALFVEVKTLGGQWTEIWRNTRQGVYADSQWLKADINFTKYAGKSVMIRFRHAKADGYSYMVLDDLKVIAEPVLDVSVQILSPKDICGAGDVKVKLTNEGQLAIAANAIELGLEYVNTGETTSETVGTAIPVGASIEYTFKKQPKLDDSGDSDVFAVKADLENDLITQNNVIKDYAYQHVSSNFKVFDNPVVHAYAGKSAYIDAKRNFLDRELNVASYKWNNGVTTSGIDITEAGDYTVTAVLENGCTVSGTVKVAFDTFDSNLASGNVCGPEVTLTPGDYAAYEWFDGSTDPAYVATESGDYYVTVYNENGLGTILRTSISVLENLQPQIQALDEKKLSAEKDATSYQWYLNGRPLPNATQKMVATIWEGSYTLETTNSNGCKSVSEPIDSKGLIIGKLTNSFRVFPNPAADNVNIFLADDVNGTTDIKIYAMNGTALFSKTYTSVPSSINVSTLNTGVYILDCTVQGKKYSAKIIKK